MSRSNIAGKVVIITGASSGLGEATARLLARGGARVVLGARRLARLDQIVAEIAAEGGQAIAVQTDVTRQEDLKALAAAGVERFGRIDVLVNNAGIMPLAPISKLRVDEWDRMIDINIKGVLYGIAAVLPAFEAQSSGHIINISSVAGIKVFAPIGSVYSATKFAVRAIAEGLRSELGHNIRSTIISPGAVESELKQHTGDSATAELVEGYYQANQISSAAVARAIAYAIEQPQDVDINEIVIRPTVQEF
ncbi:SDR family oxidoreductase [Pseudomonas sp. RP23018S]|uniref:SDR family oxidoreductase n=1 Tax=Pseudomonas sp. RP23018S TaxID=3096037 RepID=UPI002ACA1669|nr:SDR family oxidoreductase [Pseudomonas sp. RP23018S]MDZ5601807.1 SDR family oxidoreductase [Pseudomonas sp. RP23018S]